MNYSMPLQNYINNDIQAKSLNDNPHTIIYDILVELKNNLILLAYCLENKNSVDEAKSKSFSRSLKAIYILQSSLDMDNGGDIAKNLFELYDFCRITIIKSFTKQDHEKVKSLEPIISEIIDGWSDIK
ncbi:flagellar protein FliS [Alphaproteobacteria bacterium]|nr:flagellar protein FliS [Alphaproteobacteria bacterium]